MKIILRQEEETDLQSIYETNKSAFGQENEADLVNALRKNNDVFIPELSIVAIIDGEVVGHILFTKIKIIDENQTEFDSLALAPMAVIPTLQKQGIGSQLIKYGLSKAGELGYESVIVLGHEAYYPKFGFASADSWSIKAPFELPKNVFMAIELRKGGLTHVKGTVNYPPEFETV